MNHFRTRSVKNSASWKKWIRRIHLILGGIAALPLIVIAVTGMLLVFPLETQLLVSGVSYRDCTGKTPLPPAELIAAVSENVDSETYGMPTSVSYPQTSGLLAAPKGAGLVNTDKNAYLFIDPATGEILYSWILNPGLNLDSLVFIALLLHISLMAGEIGSYIVGISSFLLMAICLSGIYLWWPKGVWNATYFQIAWRKGWKRINFDAHRILGLYCATFLFLLGLTGAAMSFPQVIRPVAYWITWSKPMPDRIREIDLAEGKDFITVGELAEVAQAAFPAAEIRNLTFSLPPTPEEIEAGEDHAHTWHVRLLEPGRSDVNSIDLTVNPYTGEILQERSPATRSRGDWLLEWVGPVHFGTFGGLWTRLLYLLIAFSPIVLAFTGSLLWWNRHKKNRRPQPKGQRAAVANVLVTK